MLAIRLYDLETGHVETLAEVATVERARSWLQNFRTGGIGTSDVVYTAELWSEPGPPWTPDREGGHRCGPPS